jgi:peroxiredoxin
MRKLLFITVALVLIAVMGLAGCSSTAEEGSCPRLDAKAPNFTTQTLDGKTVQLQDYRGKLVILNFWQTTCYYCNLQMPYIVGVYKKYADSGLVVLAVNVGEDEVTVKNHCVSNNITVPVLLDQNYQIQAQYCVPAFPATLFIDKSGIIRDAQLGAFQTEGEIETKLTRISRSSN